MFQKDERLGKAAGCGDTIDDGDVVFGGQSCGKIGHSGATPDDGRGLILHDGPPDFARYSGPRGGAGFFKVKHRDFRGADIQAMRPKPIGFYVVLDDRDRHRRCCHDRIVVTQQHRRVKCGMSYPQHGHGARSAGLHQSGFVKAGNNAGIGPVSNRRLSIGQQERQGSGVIRWHLDRWGRPVAGAPSISAPGVAKRAAAAILSVIDTVELGLITTSRITPTPCPHRIRHGRGGVESP